MSSDPVQLARDIAREELPRFLGQLAEAEAVARVRLLEPSPHAPQSRILDADQAAAVAGTSKRWLLAHTKGLSCRRDLSRKVVRFDEAGLRRWLAERRR